ncbi:MAG: acetyl-CoA carboxylase carboxyltransferase subunit alpha [Alphaproteobacteria bacterium]|nr:acetyl-CoA carboxylase carboxyl transferase subunit alpha [Rhodobiaceae bacterium]OUT75123.1 MAG: acetyl-CoA carboxylase carboxyl transferase subunit alpha [Rhizobiales bacterium TMED25]
MMQYLDFEKNIAELESKVNDLKQLDPSENEISIGDNIKQLEEKASKALEKLYSTLSPWQKTKVARHPERPHFRDYIDNLFDDFIELSGDRKYSNDHAIIGGLAKFNDFNVMIIGHEKGANTSERIKHNFGMAGPEGYRKAERLMKLADRFNLPIITFVDTAGAYPGIGAEERGQSEAIARCTQTCLNVTVPIISIIIGEGGSGGAVAIATANRVTMLEHSIYTVASPEASASILWRDSSKASEAANSMRITAQDLIEMKIIDGIVSEPIGGAHRNHQKIIKDVEKTIIKNLSELTKLDRNILVDNRRNKFLSMGRNI